MHTEISRARTLWTSGLTVFALSLVASGASVLPPALAGPAAAPPAQAAAAAPCSAFTTPVIERVNPVTKAGFLTLRTSEVGARSRQGFTEARDVSLKAAPKKGAGLVPVHRLVRGGDVFYTRDLAEAASAVRLHGYQDQGTAFYASATSRSCLVGVTSYAKGGTHRYVTSAADKAALTAAGWRRERVRFYLAPAAVDPKFTIAVYPDTQQEVGTDQRFLNRSQYLVANRKALDLRFVTHVGDVVNWDTPDHAQYAVARKALAPLEQAGIPYSLSIGNHDSMATGPGGGARDPKRTRQLARDTRTFNDYLGRGTQAMEGAYERGKVDNTYHVFTAGGRSWLVLNLELWPRPGAVAWAQRVVATHPKHNVILVTHSYLTASGSISGSAEYGDTAPSVLAQQLVRKYPNVRIVLSGHTGTAKHRVDTGVHGNRIDSFLLNWTSNDTNRTRLITIDTKAGTLKTWVYAPYTKQTFATATVDLKGLSWVR